MHSAYEFEAGGETYEGVLLTDFSVGEINLKGSFGHLNEFADGILSAYTGGVIADSYENYSGDDLATADYSEVAYFGIKVVNNQGADVLFGLQGAYDDTNFFLGREETLFFLPVTTARFPPLRAATVQTAGALLFPQASQGIVLIS